MIQSKDLEEQLKSKITNYIEGCLNQNLEEAVAITKGDPERISDMEDYIAVHLSDCTHFDEPEFKNLKISKRLNDIKVSFNQDNSKIIAKLDYPIIVASKDVTLESKTFSSEIILKRSFCLDIRVNNKDECTAQEDKFISSAGLSRDIHIGDSLMAGGVCLAC